VHYYYKIYDIETGEMVNKIERQGLLKNHMVMSYTQDSKNSDCIYASIFEIGSLKVVKIEVLTNKITESSNHSINHSAIPERVIISPDLSKVHTVFSILDNNETQKVFSCDFGSNQELIVDKQCSDTLPIINHIKSYNNQMIAFYQDSNTKRSEICAYGKKSYKYRFNTSQKTSNSNDNKALDVCDLGMLDDRTAITLAKKDDNYKIQILNFDDPYYIINHEINPMKMLFVKSLSVGVIKETDEIMVYDINLKKISYFKLNSPVI
jgi:hypothetical protein